MNSPPLVSRSLGVLFIIAVFIGILGGIFSWLFRLLIGTIHNLAFAGEWSAHYDANVHTPGSWLGWLIIFVPVLGGLVVVYLIKNFAPQAKGHGVPEVMHAIYHKRGVIPANVSIVKALASAITIGTGGSLGREGPIVQISAAFSSFIGKIARLPVSQRNLLIACGASAGIAATFNAPLGGILFSIELLLVSINSRTILPVAISTVVAANVGHYLIGSEPAFAIPPALIAAGDSNALISLLAIPLGALIGLLSMLFIHAIYFSEDLFDKLPVNDYVKHIIGTALLGIVFYSIFVQTGNYFVQGVGYATIQDVLYNLISSPALLLFLLAAKVIATSLTIGSGGSGGVFSPSLFLGAMAGALFGRMVDLLIPGLGIDPVIFVVAGMAAMVSGTTSAPLTAAIIVYEMTLDYGAVLPIMTAVSIAYAVRRYFMKGDIYTLKLNRRGQMIPEELVADLKSHIVVDEAVSTHVAFLEAGQTPSGDEQFACIIEDDVIVGVVELFGECMQAHDVPVSALKKRNFVVIKSGATVGEAVVQFNRSNSDIALVSRSGGSDRDSVIGVVSSTHLIKLIGDVTRTLR